MRHVTSTVRFRVTALATMAVAIVLALASVGVVTSQRRSLTQSLEEGLAQQLDQLEILVVEDRLPPTLPTVGDDDTAAQIVVGDTVVTSTANVAGRPAIAAWPGQANPPARTVKGLPHDGSAFRLLGRVVDGPRGPAAIHVAGNLDDIDQSVRVLATSLTVAVPTAVGLLAVLAWLAVGRALRPVEAIRAEVAAIGGSELHRRVPVPTGDDEIARLARTMNDMLERIEEAGRRQQRFVADASHELRSPLTRIRSEIEVDLAHPGDADPAATHRSILDETVGMQHLVDDLLLLARSDAGSLADVEPRQEPVDLDDIVLHAARRLRDRGRVAVDTSAVSAAQVVGDAAQLARAVGNLTENAVRHARSQVTLTLEELDGQAYLSVADDGPGIPPEQRDRVFERFTRLDESRSIDHGGTGLGLAIALDVVGRHGGSLSVDPNHSPGARLVMVLPAAKQARGEEARGQEANSTWNQQ